MNPTRRKQRVGGISRTELDPTRLPFAAFCTCRDGKAQTIVRRQLHGARGDRDVLRCAGGGRSSGTGGDAGDDLCGRLLVAARGGHCSPGSGAGSSRRRAIRWSRRCTRNKRQRCSTGSMCGSPGGIVIVALIVIFGGIYVKDRRSTRVSVPNAET